MTNEYPFGYGYCQCGCESKCFEYSKGKFRKYLPFHSNRAQTKQPNSSEEWIKGKKITKDYLEKLYFEDKKSLSDISKDIGCSSTRIRVLFNKFNITARSKSEARIVALKKGKFTGHVLNEINEDFFKDITPQSAWVLGLLFTDGYMRKNTIRLALKDYDVIEKVAFHMEYAGKVKKTINGKYYIYKIDINRESIAKRLRELGIHQAKSFSITFPSILENMVRHFIRGCWDGDGGISMANNKISAYYTCGSREFIEEVTEYLFHAGVYRTVLKKPNKMLSKEWREYEKELKIKYPEGKYPIKIHKRKNREAYDLRISHPDSLWNLFNYLYEGVDESIYMDRKYMMFRKSLGIRIFSNEFHPKDYQLEIHNAEINRDFYENGLSIKQIAKKYNLSMSYIKENLGAYSKEK